MSYILIYNLISDMVKLKSFESNILPMLRKSGNAGKT